MNTRPAAIRSYLSGDPKTVHRYSIVAARWEGLRLLIDAGDGTAADDARFRELTTILKVVTAQLALSTCAEQNHPDDVPGITDWKGFLPGDPERILASDWREAASGWD